MKANSLIKNLSYNTIGMIMYNIALWFLGFFIIRMLGEEYSGYYSVAMSIGATLYGTALWGLRSYIVSNDEEFTYGDFIVVRLISIFISIILLVIAIVFYQYKTYQNIVIVLYSLFKFSEALIELFDCFYQKSLKMDINAKSMIIRSVLLTLMFYLCIKFTDNLVVGLSSTILITLGVLIFYNFRRIKELNISLSFNKQNIIKILTLTFPIMGFEMLSAFMVAIPRITFSKIGFIGDLGIYTSIYTIIVFLQLVIQILIFSISPYMAKDYLANNMKAFLSKLFGLFGVSILLALISEIGVFFLGEFVLGILYGDKIAAYYHLMYLLIISGTTLGMTWIFSQLFVILKKNYEQLFCALLCTLICFGLSNVLINPNSLNSISIVLILTNITFCLISGFILMVDRYKKKVS